MGEPRTCRTCGSPNPIDAGFCSRCGASLTQACARCGAPLPPGARFCSVCGTQVAAAPPAEQERKIVSVLFVDLVGFTARSDRADPEDVRAALIPYHARAKQEIEGLGGLVEKFIGDAVVGVFGAPAAREDDAERAVRAALRVVEAIDEINEANPGLDLAVRAAVNTGEAVVDLHARPEAGDAFVAGDVVNTASRLQGVAPIGRVVVGELTYRTTRGLIDYEELAPVAVKGKAQPVSVWLARGTRTELGGDIAIRAAAPLVGRARELELLTRLWDQAAANRPHMVTLLGPPGIGKSRLVRELAARVEPAGRVLMGRCRAYGETTGFGAFGQQVQQAAGIFATDPAAEARAKLGRLVAELIGPSELGEVAGHLEILMGLTSEGAPDQQILFYSVRRFLEALAQEQPTLLAFEDIHSAGPALLDLLESLASRIRDVPLLLVTTARPELLDARPTWGGGLLSYTAVPIEPLPQGEARELAITLLATSDEAEEVLDRMIETGGGNPLFLEELASSLAERAAGLTSELPTTVQAIIASRLDTLPAEERRVVQDAAVIGGTFWRGALAAIGGKGARLDLALDSLEGRGFIRRQPTSRVAGDREFVFKHLLTREVAYGTLPRAARRDRHAGVARYLEGTMGDRLQESASVLAHHWEEGGDPAKAARYLVSGAEAAAKAWSKRQAIELYTQAIELLGSAGDAPLLERARLGRAIEYLEAGDLESTASDLEPLLDSADPETRTRALVARAQVAMSRTDALGVHRFATEAAEAARAAGNAELEALALEMSSEASSMDGDLVTAVDKLSHAVGTWPSDRRGQEYANALGQAALVHYWRGEYRQAVEVGSRGFDLALELSSLSGSIQSAAHVGMALAGLSRIEEAIEWYQRATILGGEWEQQPRLTGRAVSMWGGTIREIGDLRGSRELSEQALEMGLRAGFLGSQMSARIDLLLTDLIQGELGKAERELPDLVRAAEGGRGWHLWLWAGRLAEARAELALLSGRVEEAATSAREALEQAQRHGRVKYASRSRTVLGRALSAQGLHAEAESALAEAVADAERLGHAPTLWSALAAQADVLEALGREAEAARARDRASASLADFAAGLSEDHRQVLLASEQAAIASPRR